MEVVLEGGLDKCLSTDSDPGKKEWRRRHFVLKHHLVSDVRCLEYYKDKTWRSGKHDPKGVLHLYPGFDVVKVNDPKRKFVFDVKTVEHTFRLAANTVDSMNEWVRALEKANTVKSFSVEVEQVDQFKRLGATGFCYLHITDSELRLIAATDGRLLVAWPFKCLRRYMSSKGKFTIEAGRRAPTGEGLFTFFSAAHDDIYKLLDSVVKSKASKGQTASPVHDEQKQQWTTAISGSTKTASSGDRYDHLGTKDLPLPSHHPHPNYNHGMSVTKGAPVIEPRYASPYGHMLGKPGVSSTLGQSLSSPPHLINELPQGRGSDFHDDHYDKLSTSSGNRQSEEEPYNVFTGSSSSPPHIGTGTESTYSVLQGTNTPGGGSWEPAVDSDNVYNFLPHQQNSPVKANATNVPHKSVYDEVGGTYNNLNPVHSPPVSDDTYTTLGHGSPVVKSWEGSFQEKAHSPLEHRHLLQQGDRYKTGPTSCSSHDEYNTLSHSTHTVSQFHSPKSSDSTYNTLDHNRSHTRFIAPIHHDSGCSAAHDELRTYPGPQVPERCPIKKQSEVIRGEAARTRSSVQRSLSVAETDLTRSMAVSSKSKTVFLSEQEAYASTEYAAVSPPAGKVPLIPTHKMAQKSTSSPVKPRLPPPRKGSAPDILVHMVSSEARSSSKSFTKGGNLISNLRASLEAGGLDLTKPKPKVLPAQLSQEESIPEDESGNYEAVNNQAVTGSSKDECSTSLYSEAYDDIYDEPDVSSTSYNSKPVPSRKPKKL